MRIYDFILYGVFKSPQQVMLVDITRSHRPQSYDSANPDGPHSTQSDAGHTHHTGSGNALSIHLTSFSEPYSFLPEPTNPGVHFPSLLRTQSMKTFRNRNSVSSKGDGGVAYIKYGDAMGLLSVAELMPTIAN